MKLVNVAQMREIERAADQAGWGYQAMMKAAGNGLAGEVQKALVSHSHKDCRVVGLVGPGNNGGDTLVALEILAKKGLAVSAYLVSPRRPDEDLVHQLVKAGGAVHKSKTDLNGTILSQELSCATILLDGVLGTGVRLPLREDIARHLAQAKSILEQLEKPPFVIAVDCPSGVDCDTGDAAREVIPANQTVCMAAVKVGLFVPPAANLCGVVQVVDIGLPEDLPAWQAVSCEVATLKRAHEILPARPNDAHKGTFGTALVIAGSVWYSGAVLLSGKACHRIGTGLVTCAVPSPLHAALAGNFPEATWLPLPDQQGWISAQSVEIIRLNLQRPTAVLIGPGLGTELATKRFLELLLQEDLPPMVIDADGLKLLAQIENWDNHLPPGCVLTPHPGEMEILTGLPVKEIQGDRLRTSERFSKSWGQVIVLKGARSVVSSPDGRTAVLPVATAALARAGTGDVLAGLITGLLAQGVPAYEAALAGVAIHGQCGLQAETWRGHSAAVLAGDLIEILPEVLRSLPR